MHMHTCTHVVRGSALKVPMIFLLEAIHLQRHEVASTHSWCQQLSRGHVILPLGSVHDGLLLHDRDRRSWGLLQEILH